MDEIYKIAPKWKDLVKTKIDSYKAIKYNFRSVTIEVHNATWCPDCEREVTELLAMLEALKSNAPKVTLYSYENKEDYRKRKDNAELEIKCLPTFIFTNSTGERIGIVEEEHFKEYIEKL